MKTQTSLRKAKHYFFSIFLSLFFFNSIAQNNSVGIGTLTPENSAILHLEKNDQGFLMTRLDSSQISGIIAPADGLITYNIQDKCYWYYKASSWERICATDSLVNSSVTTTTINANTINVDSLIANYINVNMLNTDTILNNYFYGNYVSGDTAMFNYGNINILNTDSIYNNYFFGNVVTGDTAIFNYGNINILNTDTLYNNYFYGNVINVDSVISNSVYADSLFIGGNNITNVITDSITSQAWLLHGNSGTNPSSFYLGTKDNQPLVIRTNSVEKARVLTNGNVGINTTAPTQKLDVNGQVRLRTGAALSYILQSDAIGTGSWVNPTSILTTTTLNGGAWTILGNSGTSATLNFVGTIDNVDFVVRTNNTEKARFLTNGNLGINTTAPTSKLDVNGQIRLRSGAALGFILQSDFVGTGSWVDPATLLTTTTMNSSAWTILGNTGTISSVNFVGTIDNIDFVTRTNNIERMRVTNTGRVGIGATAPTADLHIAGALGLLYTGTIGTGSIPASGAGERFMYYPKKAALRSGKVTGTDWDDINVGLYSLASGTDNISFGTNSTTFGDNNDNRDVSGFIAGTGNFLSGGGTGQIAMGRNNSVSSGGSFGDFFIGDGNISSAGQFQGALGKGNNVSVKNSYALGQNLITTGPAGASGNMLIGYNFNSNNQSNVYHFGNNNTNAASSIFFIGANNTNTNAYNALDYSFIIGRTNTLNDGNSIAIGHNNSINTNLSGAYHYVFGYNNQIIGTSNGGSMAIGFSCVVNNGHFASMAIGNSANTTSSNQLVTRFAGGVRMESNTVGSSGVVLAPGGGAWAAVSDKKMKENIITISNADILKKLLSVEVTEWNYIAQQADTLNKYLGPTGLHYDKAPVHIGPMAQDFAAAFGYGEFKDKITSTDIDGVMFASIQALALENKELKERVEQLGKNASSVDQLKLEIEELKKAIIDLKTH